jgi:hypothetical protein
MQEKDLFEPPLQFELGDTLSAKFRTPEEMSAWVNQEHQFYLAILPKAAQETSIGNVASYSVIPTARAKISKR